MAAGPTVDSDQLGRAEGYHRRRDTAVLCPVFGDIVDSTRLLEEFGEPAYDELRQTHDETVRSVVEREEEGIVLQTYGDGFLAVFSEPSTAVERCLEIQGLLSRVPTSGRAPRDRFRLRIGIDMGQVSRKRASGIVAEIFGRHVNRASRIESQAQPGSVLTSFPVYDSSVGWLRETVAWIHYPAVQLKGFADPITVHEPRPFSLKAASGSHPAEIYRDQPGDYRDLGEDQHEVIFSDQPESYLDPADPYSEALDSIGRWSRSRLFFRMFRRPRILWVDDFPENNAHLMGELSDKGVRVDTALDTESALAALQGAGYSAVVSDMARADSAMAGLDLLRKVRESGIHVPYLIFTSPTVEVEHAMASKELGAAVCTSGTVSLLRALGAALRSR